MVEERDYCLLGILVFTIFVCLVALIAKDDPSYTFTFIFAMILAVASLFLCIRGADIVRPGIWNKCATPWEIEHAKMREAPIVNTPV